DWRASASSIRRRFVALRMYRLDSASVAIEYLQHYIIVRRRLSQQTDVSAVGANHRWAMARGQDSLRLEVERRRVETAEELAQIPTPPGPARSTPLIVAGVALGILVAAV